MTRVSAIVLLSFLTLSIWSASTTGFIDNAEPLPNTSRESENNDPFSGSEEGFIENAGQWDDDILFKTNLKMGSALICRDGIYLNIISDREGCVLKYGYPDITLDQIEKEGKLPSCYNYLIGPEENWARKTQYRDTDIEERGLYSYYIVAENVEGFGPASMKFGVEVPEGAPKRPRKSWVHL